MALETSDSDLILCVLAGETEAFSPLVHKYQERLLRQITRRVCDLEVAKDLTQETWLRAFRGLQRFRCESAFSSWLYRIAENLCIDYFRRQKHRDTESLDTLEEHHISDTHSCPSRDIERAELREHLRAAVADLTPLRRRVFLLYYHEDLSIKAIAERLSKSEGTIKSHLRNARCQLQAFLTPYLEN